MLGVVALALVADFALFPPLQARWVVPSGPEGVPTITDLQFSWTSDQFRHDLYEWSGVVCGEPGSGDPDCTWRGAPDAPDPAPIPDGPAGFKRLTLLLDYALPLLYGAFALGLLTRLWDLAGRNRRWLALAAGAAAAAPLCDMTENTLHLWLLRGVDTWDQAAAADYPGGLVTAASVCASIKYGLLAVLIAFGLAGAVRWARVRRAG